MTERIYKRELARLLGVGEPTIDRMTKNGEIPHLKDDAGRPMFFRSTITTWLEKQAER